MRTTTALRRTRAVFFWTLAGVGFMTTVILAGVGIAALVAGLATARTWTVWGNVGQAFGSINTVFSGLAFIALVVTFLMQLQELRMQRTELYMQRDAMTKSHNELRRSAEADLRMLHMELIKMSIADPELAKVWPEFAPNLAPGRNRQYLYANLIYQHIRLCLQIGDYTDEEVQSHLSYLFSSPVMRAYWTAAQNARRPLVPETHEGRFAELADEICRDYETEAA